MASRILSCKHVFIENEVNLGYSKVCTSKKQKRDVRVYRKSRKIHTQNKTGNFLFAKPHPEYEHEKN